MKLLTNMEIQYHGNSSVCVLQGSDTASVQVSTFMPRLTLLLNHLYLLSRDLPDL